MDDLHRKTEEQLNIPDDVDFTIDDIVKEFGAEPASEAPKEPAEVLPEAEMPVPEDEPVRVWTPKEKASEPEPEPEPEPEILPVKPHAVPVEEPEDEEEPEEEDALPRNWQMPRLVLPKREIPVYETPEEAKADYAAQKAAMHQSVLASWIAAAVSAVLAMFAADPFGWGIMPMVIGNVGTLILLLVHCVLAKSVLWQGVAAATEGRFTVKTLFTLATLVTVIRSIAGITADSLNLCAAMSFLLTTGLWSDYLLIGAKLQTISGILSMDEPSAVVRIPKIWSGKDCLTRRTEAPSGLAEDLEKTPAAEKVLNAFAAILCAATLVFAIVLRSRADRSFLWAWNVMLLGICPVGGLLAYGRAFCQAAQRLKKAGAAISGWTGAQRMSGNSGVIITDSDLFEPSNISFNGIKTFGTYTAERILGYAVAILERSGADSVSKMFSQALTAQGGRRFKTDNFRTYEAGGLGGEIQGDVVLLGGLGFMQTMRVQMPEDMKLKQALYISVGGKAAGVFALNYSPSSAVRSGLAAILGSKGLTGVLATRDTMLTPAMVRRKYNLSADRLEYPMSKERAALASTGEKGQTGAFMAKNRFLSFAMVVCTGRQLRRSVPSAIAVALTGAIIGLFLMAILALVGAEYEANGFNLLLYHWLWLVPSALISGRVGKS